MMSDNDLHKDHRDRLRKKLYSDDGDTLEPHELLEVLLCLYSKGHKSDSARFDKAIWDNLQCL